MGGAATRYPRPKSKKNHQLGSNDNLNEMSNTEVPVSEADNEKDASPKDKQSQFYEASFDFVIMITFVETAKGVIFIQKLPFSFEKETSILAA